MSYEIVPFSYEIVSFPYEIVSFPYQIVSFSYQIVPLEIKSLWKLFRYRIISFNYTISYEYDTMQIVSVRIKMIQYLWTVRHLWNILKKMKELILLMLY